MASNEASTGKQGGAPALPNNFSAKNSFGNKSAPKIGSPGLKPSPNSNERGKDGTQG
jgi:hypothetical protein